MESKSVSWQLRYYANDKRARARLNSTRFADTLRDASRANTVNPLLGQDIAVGSGRSVANIGKQSRFRNR